MRPSPPPQFWSPDGRDLYYFSEGGLWSVGSGSPPRERLVGMVGVFELGASLSPDGEWVAFHVVEGGMTVPYIQSMSAIGGKHAISSTGGSHPLWARDGKRLFYVDSSRLMAVDVTLQPSVLLGRPVVVLDAIEQRQNIGRNYDIMPDGTRLLVLVPSVEGSSNAQTVGVALNWVEELKRLVPTP